MWSKIGWLLFSFDGRLSRLGYLVGSFLSESAIAALFAALLPYVQDSHSALVVWLVSTESFFLVWTNIALMVKRLHDCGFSGLWSLLCSPLCLLLLLFLYHYDSPLLLGATGLVSFFAIVFLTTFRDDHPNVYGTPTNGIFPRAYIGNTPIKQLSDRLEVLDRLHAEGKLTQQQHTDACQKLLNENANLLK